VTSRPEVPAAPAGPSRDRAWAAALLGLLAACGGGAAPSDGEDAEGSVWFEEITDASGVVFEHSAFREQKYWMPEILGAGLALFDHDGDGDLDLYCVQSGDYADEPAARPGNRLFRNDGTGRFEDVTEGSGADDRGNGRGVAAADYDGDGDLDLYVTNLGPNVLLRNDGGGRFTDVTAAAGVGDEGWGASAAFFDADRDGDLDIFVTNYVAWSPAIVLPCTGPSGQPDYCNPTNYSAPAKDVFYRNEGDGTFTDRSVEAGIHAAFGNGLGVAVDDFDGDGWQDVYVANDGTPNQLWINQKDGRFKDRSLLSGCAVNMNGAVEAGMGVAAFDLENDGDPDLLMTHLRTESHTLYVNRRGVFQDRTVKAGLQGASLMFTGFGMGLADFDHDGELDAYVGNGRVGRFSSCFDDSRPYAEPNQLFRGMGEGRFEEVMPRGGVADAYLGATRGLALGDIDGDGDVDLVISENGDRARVLRNVAAEGQWVGFRVVTPAGEPVRDVIGARLEVRFGEQTRWRTVTGAYGYCSANQIAAHVGLGGASSVDSVTVHWPDGGTPETFGPFPAGATHVLVRGSGVAPGSAIPK
jgi:hypothetical protein